MAPALIISIDFIPYLHDLFGHVPLFEPTNQVVNIWFYWSAIMFPVPELYLCVFLTELSTKGH